MKMIFAIVQNDDGPLLSSSLTKAGFHVTKMASTGGFLMSGNTTFIMGVEDAQVDEALGVISKYSKKRTTSIDSDLSIASGSSPGSAAPVQVHVGGATVFVMNVERFERL